MIKIRSVEIREIHLPLVHAFETSAERTTVRKIILVAVHSDQGVGYGECTAAETPFFNGETTETAWHMLSDFVVPALLGRELRHAADCASILNPIRGNRMARAALETAIWDLEARSLGLPLYRHIGGERKEIASGVSVGIQPDRRTLLEKVRLEVSAGYQRVKIKIRPGLDLEPLSAIRKEFPSLPLMADANSAYTPADLPLLRRLDELDLMMIEQPLAHDDIVDHAVLQKELRTPICLDESIRSADDARKAVEMGSCRVINVKLGRVGGYSEAIRINDYCVKNGIPVWCGGMLESGIGRAHNIAMSTLSGFVLPGDVSASKRYYAHDTVMPPVEVTSRGTIQVSESPGIGYDLNREVIDRATVRTRNFEP